MKALDVLLWSIRADRANMAKVVVEVEADREKGQAKSPPSGLNLALAEVESKGSKVVEQLTNGWQPDQHQGGPAEVDPLSGLKEVLKMLDDIKKSPLPRPRSKNRKMWLQECGCAR